MWRRFSEEERQTIWDMPEAGVPIKRITKHLGRRNGSLRKFIADAGGRARALENAPSCDSPPTVSTSGKLTDVAATAMRRDVGPSGGTSQSRTSIASSAVSAVHTAARFMTRPVRGYEGPVM